MFEVKTYLRCVKRFTKGWKLSTKKGRLWLTKGVNFLTVCN